MLRRPFALFLAAALPALANAAEPPVRRLLFVGNSITLHGPAPKIGWTGRWGMAASAADSDYVHRLAAGIAERQGRPPEFKAVNIAEFERHYATDDLGRRLAEPLTFEADTVIVAIGENVPALKTADDQARFQAAAVQLLTRLKRDGCSRIYVRSCFWSDPAKDGALKHAAQATGAVFVDLKGLDKVEANYARSERDYAHAGVARHPGDRGMRAIADALLAAMIAAKQL